MSILGKFLKLDIFGQSHSASIGMVLSNLPSGIKININDLKAFTDRRKSKYIFTTPRKEEDEFKFLSGIVNDVTAGCPICAIIENKDTKKEDYKINEKRLRPSSVDFVGNLKFGDGFDFSGSGQFSGRLTAPIVLAGGIAKQILSALGIEVNAYLSAVGEKAIKTYKEDLFSDKSKGEMILEKELCDINLIGKETFIEKYCKKLFNLTSNNYNIDKDIEDYLSKITNSGDSVGGRIECIATGLPIGLGGELFDGIESVLSYALFGIPGVKGIEFGHGFDFCQSLGSTVNDVWENINKSNENEIVIENVDLEIANKYKFNQNIEITRNCENEMAINEKLEVENFEINVKTKNDKNAKKINKYMESKLYEETNPLRYEAQEIKQYSDESLPSSICEIESNRDKIKCASYKKDVEQLINNNEIKNVLGLNHTKLLSDKQTNIFKNGLRLNHTKLLSAIYRNEEEINNIKSATNNSGGINGGITNGMPLLIGVAMRPTPTIFKAQKTVCLSDFENCEIVAKGRHDACIAIRAVVVVESLTAITILDSLLENGMVEVDNRETGLKL